jgi:hypothetical protein
MTNETAHATLIEADCLDALARVADPQAPATSRTQRPDTRTRSVTLTVSNERTRSNERRRIRHGRGTPGS